MISPHFLQSHNIPVVKVTQYPGEFIINYPGAYHAGFNHGGYTIVFAQRLVWPGSFRAHQMVVIQWIQVTTVRSRPTSRLGRGLASAHRQITANATATV